jgi:hypothetical protein
MIVSIFMIVMIVPSAFATSGSIELDEDEFVLYGGGNVITFSVYGEITDYIHRPTLEIVKNDVVIQTINLIPTKNSLFSVVGLDKDWSHGDYVVRLNYQNNILDSKSFSIFRDNFIEQKTTINENMFDIFKSYVELDVEKLVLDNNSDENIIVSGNLVSSQFGNEINFLLHSPDDTIQRLGNVLLGSDGFFHYPLIGIDKHWMSGEYKIEVNYLDHLPLMVPFTIENNFLKYPMEKEKLLGSFTLSSEVSNDFTILGITGNVKTDESEMILQISKDEIVLFEDTLSISDNLFETNTVLYDYDSNTSWVAGDYRVSGLIGDESFYSDVFRLDEQNLSVFEISSMELFLNFESEVEKMVDTDKIIISYGDEKQIILSGILENYISQSIVDVHIVNPEGVNVVSHIFASSDGAYYVPIIIDASWISGDYTAYVTSNDFVDEPSSFEVINNVIAVDETLDEEIPEIIVDDLKNYLITLDSSKSLESVHFYTEVKPYSNNIYLTISLNDEIVKNEFVYPASEGFIDYYLLLDETWVSGNYVVSHIENNVPIPFGTFEIFNNYLTEDVAKDVTVKEKLIDQYLTLDKSLFKSSSHVVEYLQFSGNLIDDSTKKVSILLDGNLQTVLPVDSEGSYAGAISLGDNLDSGYHNLSISSGNIAESAEFLIATNHYVSLDGDLEILRNTIAESGGEVSLFLSKMVPNFVPSEVQPVIITVEGDDYYERFSVMPKAYGFYSQNFILDESLGSYDVSVMYGDELIESYNIDVLLPAPEWIKSHTALWLNGEINDYSYFKKIVLMLDDNYVVTPNVTSPEWFVESADNWMQGLMDDDSFNDALLFLAENRLL